MSDHVKALNYTFKLAIWFALVIFFCVGCMSTSGRSRSHRSGASKPSISAMKRSPLTSNDRKRLSEIARKAIGKSSLRVGQREFRSDCSGVVRAIFAQARIGLGGIIKNNRENDVKAIYRYVQKYGQILKSNPAPGDLVFFHNTYDRSRNGRMNDALTHVGIVEKTDGTTVHFIHHLGQSIIRSRLDLSSPRETFHPQKRCRINHILRRAQGKHRAYTAAELFAGFGRL